MYKAIIVCCFLIINSCQGMHKFFNNLVWHASVDLRRKHHTIKTIFNVLLYNQKNKTNSSEVVIKKVQDLFKHMNPEPKEFCAFLSEVEDFLLLWKSNRLNFQMTFNQAYVLSQAFLEAKNQFNREAQKKKTDIYKEIAVEESWIDIYRCGKVERALYRIWENPVTGYVRSVVIFKEDIRTYEYATTPDDLDY